MTDQDQYFMQVALDEARKGIGRTSPNPCVGAVVVNNGCIVGRGYHKKAGTPHAEIHALADAGTAAKGATMYVTLEPCNHTGRTPPCSHAVYEAGISRVVIGCKDPNPLAQGGAEYLAAQGLVVESGVCEQKCRALNYPFFKHVRTGLPWVVMKAGLSLDGRITYQQGQGGAITGKESREFVHGLRNRLDAILIGANTAVIDNPSLTTRLQNQETRDPLRVIVDSELRTEPGARLFRQQSNAETWIFCASSSKKTALREKREQELIGAGAKIFPVSTTENGKVELKKVLQVLGAHNILSVLVEGGAAILGSFVRNNLIDEVYLLLAPFFIGDQGQPLLTGYRAGSREQVKRLQDITVTSVGEDTLIHGLWP